MQQLERSWRRVKTDEPMNHAKRLLNECSSVVRNDDELRKLILNDVEWEKRIPGFLKKIIINWAPRS